MGMLFTTRGTRRIIDALNTAFSEKGMSQIRGDESTKLWLTDPKKDWKLVRAAYAYSIFPISQDPDDNPGVTDPKSKKKWHYFLKDHLGSSSNKPVHDQIRDAIRDGLLAVGSISRFSFDHVELAPSSNVSVVIFDAPIPGATTKLRQFTLLTPAVPKNQDGTDFDPTPGEGEPGQKPLPGQ